MSYLIFIIVDVEGTRMLEQTQHSRVACPECGTRSINVQGVDVCPECAWVANDD
jgi:ribosomal protein L37AE/L43A